MIITGQASFEQTCWSEPHPQPGILLHLVRERLTDPDRRHRLSDVEDPPRSG
jgi:hypothetical protein